MKKLKWNHKFKVWVQNTDGTTDGLRLFHYHRGFKCWCCFTKKDGWRLWL